MEEYIVRKCDMCGDERTNTVELEDKNLNLSLIVCLDCQQYALIISRLSKK